MKYTVQRTVHYVALSCLTLLQCTVISGGMQAMQEHALHSHNALGGAVKTFSLGKTLTLGSPSPSLPLSALLVHIATLCIPVSLRAALRSCDLPIPAQMHHFSPTQQETFVFSGFVKSKHIFKNSICLRLMWD